MEAVSRFVPNARNPGYWQNADGCFRGKLLATVRPVGQAPT